MPHYARFIASVTSDDHAWASHVLRICPQRPPFSWPLRGFRKLRSTWSLQTLISGFVASLLSSMRRPAWIATLLCVFVTTPVVAGPVRYVNQAVSVESQIAVTVVDHTQWTALLQKFVDQDGNVDYQQWKSNADDRAALQQYLRQLGTAKHVSAANAANRAAVLAFWINAYNALTVEGILREYPTSSIKNHTPRLVGYNLWKHLQLRVAGTDYSLEDIEHRVLRKMREPRIHFAIVCASRSCPRLLNEAYTPDKLESQLKTNTLDFFARTQNFRFSESQQRYQLSPILKWFAGDFGRTQSDVLRRIASWLPTESARRAAAKGEGRVGYLEYDWSLNERSERSQ